MTNTRVSKEVIARSLTANEIDSTTNEDYDIIKNKNFIELTDYIDNITFVVHYGSNEPIIVQVYNALNTTG